MKPADIQAHLDSLTKPPGSLGRLETLAAELCRIQGTLRPETRPRRLVVFAGDHGVVEEKVGAWPSAVTTLMIDNIRAGGAASSVLARTTGTDLVLVDVGSLAGEREAGPGYRYRRVRAGTRNLAQEPALTPEEWSQAFEVGADEADAAERDGVRVVAGGEMGIGNSTPAACLAALLLGRDAAFVTGRGAGADDETLARKRAVVARAVAREAPRLAANPTEAIASVAGLEIAALAGFYDRAARLGLTIVLDGSITTAAALAAAHLRPGIAERLVAAHRSAEPAHGPMLEALGLRPLLEWEMRLGEGTAALLAMPLLDAAAALVRDMATFEQAGIRRG
jgi:nicotinate-nucleotide--dimethylbenzimidazole phosphoribosyltransferase